MDEINWDGLVVFSQNKRNTGVFPNWILYNLQNTIFNNFKKENRSN